MEKKNMSLVVIIFFVIITIVALFILVSNSGDERQTVPAVLEELPREPRLMTVHTHYGAIFQMESRRIYVKHDRDIYVNGTLLLRQGRYYEMTRNRQRMREGVCVILETGYPAWFIAYDDGTVERIDVVENVTNITGNTFIVTPLPQYKDIVRIWNTTGGIIGENMRTRVFATDSNGNQFTILDIEIEDNL